MCATLSNVSVSANHRYLPGNHYVRCALDAVYDGFAASVEIVEFRFRYAVVYVDGRKRQPSVFEHLIEAVHARSGFFGYAANIPFDFAVPFGVFGQFLPNAGKQPFLFFATRVVENGLILFRFASKNDQKRGVAAVIENHVRRSAVVPIEYLVRVVPIFFERFALLRENGNSSGCNCRSGVVLGREDIAARPSDIRSEVTERLNEHGGLDSHMEGACYPCALKGLGVAVLFSQCHKSGHFGLCYLYFLASEFGKSYIGDFVVHGLFILKLRKRIL